MTTASSSTQPAIDISNDLLKKIEQLELTHNAERKHSKKERGVILKAAKQRKQHYTAIADDDTLPLNEKVDKILTSFSQDNQLLSNTKLKHQEDLTHLQVTFFGNKHNKR